MRKILIICDRCRNNYQISIEETKFQCCLIIDKHDFVPTQENWDLCRDCFKLLEVFLETKPND